MMQGYTELFLEHDSTNFLNIIHFDHLWCNLDLQLLKQKCVKLFLYIDSIIRTNGLFFLRYYSPPLIHLLEHPREHQMYLLILILFWARIDSFLFKKKSKENECWRRLIGYAINVVDVLHTKWSPSCEYVHSE